MHGKYPHKLKDPGVDCEQLLTWLRSAGHKTETEGFIIAALDQSLNTKVYKVKILKDSSNPFWRIYHRQPSHNWMPCISQNGLYIQRHNTVR